MTVVDGKSKMVRNFVVTTNSQNMMLPATDLLQ